MRQHLEGKKTTGLPEEWYEYRLARMFGWTPAQIADAPAHWSDWALAFAEIDRPPRG